MTKGVRVNEETRVKILSNLKKGERAEIIANRYGLSKETIWKIARQFSRIKIGSEPSPSLSSNSSSGSNSILRSDAVSGSTGSKSAEFIELGVYEAPTLGAGARAPSGKRLEISVKSEAASFNIDGIIDKDQVNLIFKLIEGLC